VSTPLGLSQTAVYALRALSILAARPDEPVRSAELAERTHIPTAYLSKVMRRLVLGGLVSSQRGHGGGFTLACDPAETTILEVLDAVDSPLDSEECAFGWRRCNERKPCPLHPVWGELKERLQAWAEETTLADASGQA